MTRQGINVMVYKFLLVFFIILDSIFFSYGLCNFSTKDSPNGKPPGCYSSECNETTALPTNNICSISYLLYTAKNPDTPCYVEPRNEEFDHCAFDPSLETKILIHGYLTKLLPGNVYEKIKESLLSIDTYNVFIVDWTNYNQGDYLTAFNNAYLTGIQVGKFISYLTNEKGQAPEIIHVIGHSLGAHVAGVSGKEQVRKMGRITGLDPASPLYKRKIKFNRLTDTDALFVDVIHCSNGRIGPLSEGFGIPAPIGNINFYPNGGVYQPACVFGRNYVNADFQVMKIKTQIDLIFCRHDICPVYFWHSIQDCKFVSRQCQSYKRYKRGRCFSKSHPTDLMGFYAEPIPGLPNNSKFYLDTTAYPPYCLQYRD